MDDIFEKKKQEKQLVPTKDGASSAGRGADVAGHGGRGRLCLRGQPAREPRGGRWTRRVVAKFWQNFGKISLVFGCIGADLWK